MNEKTWGHIPNFRHLRVFREVARSKSISLASPEVHLSQPAMTQAIANLEDLVGVPLFERRPDGMELTEMGATYLLRVDRALTLVTNGAKEAIRVGTRKNGRGFSNFDRLLTTAQLRSLIAVSTGGNFTLAARSAGVSQPTLHRAARDLERLSGIALFRKTGKGIDLTAAAQALAQPVKLAFAELTQGFDEIHELLGIDKGCIKIGAMPLPRTFVLPTAISLLLGDRPNVSVSVVDGPYDDLLHGLRHGELDLLVGALRNPIPIDDVVQEALFNDPLAVVGRVGHPLSMKATLSMEDLGTYPWVVPRSGTPTRAHFEKMFAGQVAPTRIIETSSLVLIRGLLMDSERLTLISAHQIRHERQMGLLAPLNLDLAYTSRPIGITHRRDWHPTPTQRRALECLREAGKVANKN